MSHKEPSLSQSAYSVILLNKKKRRQNTITTFGHYIYISIYIFWLAEIVIIGVIPCTTVKKETVGGGFLYSSMCYFLASTVIFPCIHAITSQELRAHVSYMKCCHENDGNAAAKEIELKVVVNGNQPNGNVPNLWKFQICRIPLYTSVTQCRYVWCINSASIMFITFRQLMFRSLGTYLQDYIVQSWITLTCITGSGQSRCESIM